MAIITISPDGDVERFLDFLGGNGNYNDAHFNGPPRFVAEGGPRNFIRCDTGERALLFQAPRLIYFINFFRFKAGHRVSLSLNPATIY